MTSAWFTHISKTQSKFAILQVLFSRNFASKFHKYKALAKIYEFKVVTIAEDTVNVYGLPEGQGLDHRVDMAGAVGQGHINLVVYTLSLGQAINLVSFLVPGA